MRRVLLLVRREVREILRQRALVATMVTLLLVIVAAHLALLAYLDTLMATPSGVAGFAHFMKQFGMPMDAPAPAMAQLVLSTLTYLEVAQLLGMTAVLAGHAALHDRLCGTRPFLLLAPVTRLELLTGKVLGALFVPHAVFVITATLAGLVASTSPLGRLAPDHLPTSGAWWVMVALGAPAWATAVGTLCVLVSGRVADVRTAQQAAWFLVFFATLALSPLLVSLLPLGALVQLAVAGAGLLSLTVLLGMGAQAIGRLA